MRNATIDEETAAGTTKCHGINELVETPQHAANRIRRLLRNATGPMEVHDHHGKSLLMAVTSKSDTGHGLEIANC